MYRPQPLLLLLLHDVTCGMQARAPVLEGLPCAYACSTHFPRGNRVMGKRQRTVYSFCSDDLPAQTRTATLETLHRRRSFTCPNQFISNEGGWHVGPIRCSFYLSVGLPDADTRRISVFSLENHTRSLFFPCLQLQLCASLSSLLLSPVRV